MTLLYEEQSLYEIELGKIVQIPCKFIQGKSETHPILVKNLAKQLEKTKQNYLPIIVQLLEEDSYKAVRNIQILEAARLAKLDFAFCVVVDEEMLEQIAFESGEVVRLNILSASAKEIEEVLDYIKKQKAGFRTIKPKKAAKVIVEQRETTTIKNLNFLIKQRCGIGKATLSKIKDFLVIE